MTISNYDISAYVNINLHLVIFLIKSYHICLNALDNFYAFYFLSLTAPVHRLLSLNAEYMRQHSAAESRYRFERK